MRIAACGRLPLRPPSRRRPPRRRAAGRWCSGTRAPAPSRRSARASCTSRPAIASCFCMIPSCGACSACRAGRPDALRAGGRRRRARHADGRHVAPALPDGTPLQHGLTVACFAERARRRRCRRRAADRRRAALAGRAARLRRGHRHRSRAQRRAAAHRRAAPRWSAAAASGSRSSRASCSPAPARSSPSTAIRRCSSSRSRAARRMPSTRRADDPAAAVRALTGGGVDHAFEVVGRPETMRLAWDCLRAGGTAVVVGLARGRRRGGLPRHRVPLRQGHQGLLLRQRQPLGRARLARAAGGRRAARAGRRGHEPDRSRRHSRGPRAAAQRRGRPHRRDPRRAAAAGVDDDPESRFERSGSLVHVRDDVHDRDAEQLAHLLDEVLAQPARALAGCVEITIRSASKRSSASRTAANGTMSPTQPSASRPSPRSTASVRSSRSCAASIAPAWLQVSPTPCSAATAGATTRNVEAVLVLDPPQLGEQLVGFDRLVRDHKHAGHAPPPGGLCSRCYNRSRAARPERYSTWPTANDGDGEHDGADQAPDLEREAVHALRHEHEHDRTDDPEPDDPHRDLAELVFHVSSWVEAAHMLPADQPPALLTCSPLPLEVGDDLRAVIALDLDHAVDDAAARSAQALELARELASPGPARRR